MTLLIPGLIDVLSEVSGGLLSRPSRVVRHVPIHLLNRTPRRSVSAIHCSIIDAWSNIDSLSPLSTTHCHILEQSRISSPGTAELISFALRSFATAAILASLCALFPLLLDRCDGLEAWSFRGANAWRNKTTQFVQLQLLFSIFFVIFTH